ncbi:MAG TPA: hypothetical protein VGH28_17475 [Polyangiaceae bacterium]
MSALALACGDRTFPTGGDAASDAGISDAPLFPDVAPVDAEPPGTSEVFAHSQDTLYRLDPKTQAVTTIGLFTGCSSVEDIALDASSTMYATTLDGLYTVDRATAKCTLVATGTYPNSLSFVPAGTLDANNEALVGFLGDQYVRIDQASGAMTTVGAIGGGYTSSGDVVSVKGGGTYLTVKGGPNSCNDCLIQVDPKNGSFLLEWGPLGHTAVFGIAFWGGSVYGFDAGGEIFKIDFQGLAMQISTVAAPPGTAFYGAGSTTVAPLVPN